MTEADLWRTFHAALVADGGFGVRIESASTGLGIPDSHVSIGRAGAWVENKIAFGNARPDVKGQQAGFGVRAERDGVRAVCMAARSPTEVALWPLWLFADLVLEPGSRIPYPEWQGLISEAPRRIVYGPFAGGLLE